MLKLIFRTLLTLYWNFVSRYQIPVNYSTTMTDNHFCTKHEKRTEESLITTIFIVHQYKHTRHPRRFFAHVVYCYKVEAVIYHEEEFVDSRVWILPELCSAIYRGTKVPHVCAVNSIVEQMV